MDVSMKPKSNTLLILGIIIAIVVIVGVFVALWFFNRHVQPNNNFLALIPASGATAAPTFFTANVITGATTTYPSAPLDQTFTISLLATPGTLTLGVGFVFYSTTTQANTNNIFTYDGSQLCAMPLQTSTDAGLRCLAYSKTSSGVCVGQLSYYTPSVFTTAIYNDYQYNTSNGTWVLTMNPAFGLTRLNDGIVTLQPLLSPPSQNQVWVNKIV
jgi:hypothetical protein